MAQVHRPSRRGGNIDDPDAFLAEGYDPDRGQAGSRSFIYEDEPGDAVDTDGDGIPDAILYRFYPDADANSPEGKFHVAIRVVDLSGKVCINTASNGDANGTRAGDTLATKSPALINLLSLFPPGTPAVSPPGGGSVDLQTLYNQYIHLKRCGGKAGVALLNYDADCGRKLLSPEAPYDPFPIGDEVFLMWCEPLQFDSVANVGRLHEAIGWFLKGLRQDANGAPVGDQIKRMLTTFSCTSAVVRNPDPSKGLETLTYLDAVGGDQAIYERVKVMLERLGLGTNDAQQQYMASAFVSNLKTYVSPESSGRFKPKDKDGQELGFTTYGYRGDLVITEVLAKDKKPSEAGKQDWAWGCAIELMNPTGGNIDVGGYRLDINGRAVSLNGTVQAGVAAEGSTYNKIVFYRYTKGADANMTATDFFGNPGDWQELGDLDFGGDGTSAPNIKLIRKHTDGDIPVDQVKASDFGYVRKQGDEPDEDQFVCIYRDDRFQMQAPSGEMRRITRYLFPYYGSDSGAHTLGSANPVPASVADGQFPVTFQSVERTSTTRLLSVGELCNIHLVSPVVDGADEEVTFGHRIVKDDLTTVFPDCYTRGKLPFFPLGTSGGAQGAVGYGGYSAGGYPDVPAGCMYAEFFTNVARHIRPKEKGRIYGRLNVNTAVRKALLALPWPPRIEKPLVNPASGQRGYYRSGDPGSFRPEEAVRWILDYRNSPNDSRWRIDGLRSGSAGIHGFLTPGEVAIPLAAYMDSIMLADPSLNIKTIDELAGTPGFFEARHGLYRAIADSITTRSDVFAVYIRVQQGATGRYNWHYLAVVDRSNVLEKRDKPAILLFTEIPPTEDED